MNIDANKIINYLLERIKHLELDNAMLKAANEGLQDNEKKEA